MAKARQQTITAAPVPEMVDLDDPPRRVKLYGGKPWLFQADSLFVFRVQREMKRSLYDVSIEMYMAMDGDTPKPPPMDLVYELAYHLTATHRREGFKSERVETDFEDFLALLGVPTAKAQGELFQMVMGLINEAMSGKAPAQGNAATPAPTTETATSPQAG